MTKSTMLHIILLFLLASFHNTYANDTVYVYDLNQDLSIQDNLEIFEDNLNTMRIEDILGMSDTLFYANERRKLNFNYTTSTIWLKFALKNDTRTHASYVLEISNPDLDYVDFYEAKKDRVIKEVHTGELTDVSSRETFHRNFLFNIEIDPGESYEYYIAVNNNGHSCTIPLRVSERSRFNRDDRWAEMFNWITTGFLAFIMIFNIYLYRAIKDRVNLYYALSLLFAIIFIVHYEGYLFIFNPPVIVEKLKYISPCLYSLFLLYFTKSFISSSRRFVKLDKYITPLVYFVLLAPLAYNLNYPFSLITDVGVATMVLLIFVLIIFMSVMSYDKNYPPSQLFLFAYVTVFLGLFLHLAKEFGIINPNFFVRNSIKFGLTLQNILLTIAVLERFRINQDSAQSTIRNNLLRIEIQNKELEIINSELEKLSIVASETDNGVAIYDHRGVIEWANSGFENMYSVKLDVLIRSKRDHIDQIVPNAHIREYVDKCMESKLPVVFETEIQSKSKELWIQTTLSPYLRAGSIHKIIAIDSDITSLKVYEKELETSKEKAEESDRLKTAFLGNLSHEIRTPLNGILGFSELLNRGELNESERTTYLEIIKTSGEQLMHIIDDIVDISLIESNQLKIYKTDVDLKLMIHEVMDFFESYRGTISKKEIDLLIDLNIGEEIYCIQADPFRLKQVLTNLVKNGFKFTHEGYVKLGAYAKDNFLYFYVEDTGIGVSPEVKDFIFERFRQGEESLNRKYGGTGLGLSISKGIIEKMGGSIWLDGTHQKGFKILFNIPLEMSATPSPVPELPAQTNHIGDKIRGKKILIVEDHDVSYKYLKEILQPYEPEIDWATDGEQAVVLVKEKEYDLVLMDINLPGMDGVSATREIRKIYPDLPVFVQTAHAMETEIKTILASGCNEMIDKPFNEEEFFEKLWKIL